MFEHKINFCIDVVRYGMFSMCLAVLYLCIIWVHIGFVCVYFECMFVIEHILNSKWFQISTSWTPKNAEHTLASICREGNHLVRQYIIVGNSLIFPNWPCRVVGRNSIKIIPNTKYLKITVNRYFTCRMVNNPQHVKDCVVGRWYIHRSISLAKTQ